MAGVQSVLVFDKIPGLEEFKKKNSQSIEYLLAEYKTWKALKKNSEAENFEALHGRAFVFALQQIEKILERNLR